MIVKYIPKQGDKFYECSCGLIFKAHQRNVKCPICDVLEKHMRQKYNKLYDGFKNIDDTRIPNTIERFVNERKTNK